ncbi:MAG TPA: alpha/beta fold hydrolase [Candidatus Angelobacter sp.]|nr:alpha/beta fold hydrolase [Candidatus Angelobacter sp.]
MKISRNGARAIGGILLCAIGVLLALPNAYREKTYVIPAGGCQLETTIVDKPDGAPQGTVVLFHGISANKKIMFYLARGFAEQHLRVYVADLPGHGHSAGPFSPERAEDCATALVSGLVTRGIINPDRTILAGHSMGGAIALRVGTRVPVAGVVAISPAPMRATHGAKPEMLLFHDSGQLPEHFLVMSGTLELESMRGNAADLASSRTDDSAQYIEIPQATHVSILFDSQALRAAQEWTSRAIHLSGVAGTPSRRPLYGAIAGFVGVLLLVNPFLREATGKKEEQFEMESGVPVPWGRALAEFAVASGAIVAMLRYRIPLRAVHVFQGDYLASFLLLLGAALLFLHGRVVRETLSRKSRGLLAAVIAAILLFLLFSAWFELSLYESWLTGAKWLRFPFLFVALLPYHFAEELFLGPVGKRSGWRRIGAGLLLRMVAWSALAIGVLHLHSGEMLLVLLLPYFLLVHVLQRRGMDIVREETGSPAAAALFGAILFAGFCLVIFPIT